MRPSRLFALLSISFAGLIGVSAAQTTAAAASKVTFTTLADFGVGDGQYPSSLAQGTDGNLFGATYQGGAYEHGTVFRMTSSGSITTLYTFCPAENCLDGYLTDQGLILGTDGDFYGVTSGGGTGQYRTASQKGTAFRITPQGTLTTLYSFCSKLSCQDGAGPDGPLVQGSDGNFYGDTGSGGLYNAGTVFVLTSSGALTTLHSFDSTDGSSPLGSLVQATDGNFYGITIAGGSGPFCLLQGGCGTVFRITPQGALTTLYNFCQQSNCPDGAYPEVGLIQAADGNLYGTTLWGGNTTTENNVGFGTVFKISLGGKFTSLYAFCSLTNCPDGEEPSGLIQATDGNFYGTTRGAGAVSDSGGTIFELTTGGKLTTLYDFCPLVTTCPDGAGPEKPMQATDGNFYGVTFYEGTTKYGTSFQLSTGLGPFVQTVATSGQVGSSVIILGNNLTGATSVTFNGTSAGFTVASSTEITATVPTGATTGPVVVTTTSSTLKSNKKFRIIN